MTQKLWWIDLETTGLEPRYCEIIEICVREAAFEDPFTTAPILCLAVKRRPGPMSEFVTTMHTKSGLLAECDSGVELSDVEERLLERAASETDKPIIAGSSVHFDLAFIREHMPRLASQMHYRCYDVRAVALFCESLGMQKPPKAEAHRAEADILESIALGEACAEWLGR